MSRRFPNRHDRQRKATQTVAQCTNFWLHRFQWLRRLCGLELFDRCELYAGHHGPHSFVPGFDRVLGANGFPVDERVK